MLVYGFVIWNEFNKIPKLTDFDISVDSWLDLMPTFPKDDNPRKAYFVFALIGIEKDEFLDGYEIESIKLNNISIKNEDIIYDIDGNGFRFYSTAYKDNNVINLIIRNKKTNIDYSKKLKVSTEVVL